MRQAIQAPAMPATLDELAATVPGVGPGLIRRVADFLYNRRQLPFREVLDPALELLAGVVPPWPLLDEWNRWCLDNGASFFVWRPEREGLGDRARLEALLHTILMLAGKERGIADYRDSLISEAEVVMAGDDCVICDQHRHAVVPLLRAAMARLAPFHPGCRCGILPRLEGRRQP
jgi:hypothetical protein